MSGIQEHTGVLTRSLRREVGEPHTELKSKIPKSKNPEYVSGYNARRKDEKKKVRPLVEVLNPNNPYNKGYFGASLKENKDGYFPRTYLSGRGKKGNNNPFSGSEGSASETSASERAATRPTTRQSQRMRSTMLSQTLTPESNIYVPK
jgi:hypothetical protein